MRVVGVIIKDASNTNNKRKFYEYQLKIIKRTTSSITINKKIDRSIFSLLVIFLFIVIITSLISESHYTTLWIMISIVFLHCLIKKTMLK